MECRIQAHCGQIEWNLVRDCLKEAGMAHYEPDRHQRAFENSFAVLFVFREEEMIGFGRALSDGAYQAAIYDVAVLPAFQKRGVGKLIMECLLEKLSRCNVILYANPGKEGFYMKSGFASLKTGMALFLHPEAMKRKGIL